MSRNRARRGSRTSTGPQGRRVRISCSHRRSRKRLGLDEFWMDRRDGGPPLVTPKKTLNADFLFRCTEVVGARFRAKARPTLQEIQMACYLYEMFQANADATTDAQMTLFIDQWLEFAKRSITHSP